MNFFQRLLFDYFKRNDEAMSEMKAVLTNYEPTHDVGFNTGEYYISEGYQQGFNIDLYSLNADVQNSVDKVAETCSKQNVKLFRMNRKTGEVIEQPNHIMAKLLTRPNDKDTWTEWIESMVKSYIITGNAYTWVNRVRPDAWVQSLDFIPAKDIYPVAGELLGSLKGYKYQTGKGAQIDVYPWQVSHIRKVDPKSNYTGESALTPLRTDILAGRGMSEQLYRTYVQNRGQLPSIVAVKGAMKSERWEAFKTTLFKNQRVDKYIPVRLGDGEGSGIQVIPASYTAKDAMIVELREQNSKKISDSLSAGLDAVVSGDANRASANSAYEVFYDQAIDPILNKLEERLNMDVFGMYDRDLFIVIEKPHKVDPQLEIDKERLEIERQRAYLETHTINEARQEFYGEPPIDGGDVLINVPQTADPLNFLDFEVSKRVKAYDESPIIINSPKELEATTDLKKRPVPSLADDIKFLALEDLEKWRQKSVRYFKKKREIAPFDSSYIVDPLKALIEMKGQAVKSLSEVDDLFGMVINSLVKSANLKADLGDGNYHPLADDAIPYTFSDEDVVINDQDVDDAISAWDDLMPSEYAGMLDAEIEGDGENAR
jgi:phage portal protein BeeE